MIKGDLHGHLLLFAYHIRPHPPSPSPCFLLATLAVRNDGEEAVLQIFNPLYNYYINFISLFSIFEKVDSIAYFER